MHLLFDVAFAVSPYPQGSYRFKPQTCFDITKPASGSRSYFEIRSPNCLDLCDVEVQYGSALNHPNLFVDQKTTFFHHSVTAYVVTVRPPLASRDVLGWYTEENLALIKQRLITPQPGKSSEGIEVDPTLVSHIDVSVIEKRPEQITLIITLQSLEVIQHLLSLGARMPMFKDVLPAIDVKAISNRSDLTMREKQEMLRLFMDRSRIAKKIGDDHHVADPFIKNVKDEYGHIDINRFEFDFIRHLAAVHYHCNKQKDKVSSIKDWFKKSALEIKGLPSRKGQYIDIINSSAMRDQKLMELAQHIEAWVEAPSFDLMQQGLYSVTRGNRVPDEPDQYVEFAFHFFVDQNYYAQGEPPASFRVSPDIFVSSGYQIEGGVRFIQLRVQIRHEKLGLSPDELFELIDKIEDYAAGSLITRLKGLGSLLVQYHYHTKLEDIDDKIHQFLHKDYLHEAT